MKEANASPKDEALRIALEYVELVPDDRYSAEHIDQDALITAIKAALLSRSDGEAQTRSVDKDEPMAWGASALSKPEYVAEQKEKTKQLRNMMDKFVQKPVAWMHPDWPDSYSEFQSPVNTYMTNGWIPLYTTPPQRTWVGLTGEEKIIMSRYDLEYAALIGEVERKLKELNT